MADRDEAEGFRGRKAVVRYGQGGHEHEFCVNVAGYDLDAMIPNSLFDSFVKALPEDLKGASLNRGSRLEIVSAPERAGEVAAALVTAGLEVVPERDFPW